MLFPRYNVQYKFKESPSMNMIDNLRKNYEVNKYHDSQITYAVY